MFSPDTVIPTLVMVEVWHWTPLVMLIVLGGLAGLPKEPYESAVIDGANDWHMFRYITLPLLWPYIMIALIIRTIDALKVFDIIFVISEGGPGTASETLNIFLYLQAFQFYKIGYAVRRGGDLLRHHRAAVAAAALHAPEIEVERMMARLPRSISRRMTP